MPSRGDLCLCGLPRGVDDGGWMARTATSQRELTLAMYQPQRVQEKSETRWPLSFLATFPPSCLATVLPFELCFELHRRPSPSLCLAVVDSINRACWWGLSSDSSFEISSRGREIDRGTFWVQPLEDPHFSRTIDIFI